MNFWPIPNSYKQSLPPKGDTGSFWENRDDRYNCGVDIFAPEGSDVFAATDGMVVEIGVFTKADIPYFNRTYYLIVKTNYKIFFKYAFFEKISVSYGEKIKSGQKIGSLAKLINIDGIDNETPLYIRNLANKEHFSMLHIELTKVPVMHLQPYEHGNFLSKRKPMSLLNPSLFLNGNS